MLQAIEIWPAVFLCIYNLTMTVKLMHNLITTTDYIFQEMTDTMSDKDIGNDFWRFVKSKFLDDNQKKIKVFDYCYNVILNLDCEFYRKKYGVNIDNIKKTKEQITFCSEILSKMLKHSDIPLIDY